MADDAEYGATFTMRFQAALAKATNWMKTESRAGDVNFAGNTFPDPSAFRKGRNSCDFYNFPHELVPWRAAKAVIAAKNFDVCVADSGEADFDKRPARVE